MTLGQEQLIDTVVAGIEDDAEMVLQARQHLGEMVVQDATDEELAASAQRVAAAGWKRWQKMWLIAVLVVSVPMVVVVVGKLRQGVSSVRGSISPIMMIASPEPNAHPGWAQGMGAEARLILFGAEGAITEVDRWKPLWDGDRENALYYKHFAKVYMNEDGRLPPDFLETGKSLEPDNGWYDFIVATHDWEDVVRRESVQRADRETGVAAPHEVLDEEDFNRRIAQLHEAARAPELLSGQKEFTELRYKIMPSAGDFFEMVQSYMLWAEVTISTSTLDAARLISAEAQRCQRDEDREGFDELVATWNRLVETQLDQGHSLVEALIGNAFLAGTLPSMRDAAQALDMNGGGWTDLETAVRERKQELSKGSREEPVVTQHGSMLGSLSLPMIGRQVEQMEPLKREDLLPSVRVEQAFLRRVLCASGWQLTGLVLLVSWLGMWAVPKLVRSLGSRLQGVLRPVDWMWIMLGGVLAPMVIFLLFRYATPFSRLDWGPRLTLYVIPIGHFIALLMMWLVWPLIIAAWRMEIVGGMFGWVMKKRVFAWIVMAAPPVAMVLLGLGVPMGGHSLVMLGGAVVAGILCLVWLAFRPGCGAQSVFGRRLLRVTHWHAVRPAWLGAMLGFALMIPLFHAEERRWMKRDEVLRPTSSMTAYEGRVTEQVIQELRDLLEAHPVR